MPRYDRYIWAEETTDLPGPHLERMHEALMDKKVQNGKYKVDRISLFRDYVTNQATIKVRAKKVPWWKR